MRPLGRSVLDVQRGHQGHRDAQQQIQSRGREGKVERGEREEKSGPQGSNQRRALSQHGRGDIAQNRTGLSGPAAAGARAAGSTGRHGKGTTSHSEGRYRGRSIAACGAGVGRRDELLGQGRPRANHTRRPQRGHSDAAATAGQRVTRRARGRVSSSCLQAAQRFRKRTGVRNCPLGRQPSLRDSLDALACKRTAKRADPTGGSLLSLLIGSAGAGRVHWAGGRCSPADCAGET
jgi:hypothetical protein